MNKHVASLARLMPRDASLFTLLNAAGWLSSPQIHDVFWRGKTKSAANKRLHILEAAGYVVGEQVSSTEPKYYRLGPRGRRVLEEHLDPGEVISAPARLPRDLRHFIAVNDLRLAFDMGLPAGPLKLDYFHAEREYPRLARLAGSRPHLLLQLLSGDKLKPDALAAVSAPGRVVELAVEYDAGTEPAHYFGRAKMKAYLACVGRNPGAFASFGVLVVAPSRKRLASLMRQTALVQPPRGMFHFALIEKFTRPDWPRAPILLDPTEYFAPAQEGGRLGVVERPLDPSALPRHSLETLLATPPRSPSPRGESFELATLRESRKL